MVFITKLPVLAMMAGTVLAVTFPQHIERLEPYIAHSLPQTLQQFLLRPQRQQQQQPQPDIHRRNVAYYTETPTTLTTAPDIHRRNVAYYTEAPTTLTTATTTTTQMTSEEPSYVESETELVQRQLPDEPEFQQITRASVDPTLRRQNHFLDIPDTKKPIQQSKSVHLKSPMFHPKIKFTKKEKKDAIDSSHLVYEEPTPQGGSFTEDHQSKTNFEERDFQTAGHDSSPLFRGATNSVYESPAHHSPAPHFEHTSSPHYEHTPEPQYEISPAPQFEHSPAPHFEQSPAPHFEHSPAPHFDHSSAPHFEHSSAPQFDPSSTTHFEHPPTAHFEQSPAPRFDISASQASTSHSAHFSAIPSPHFSSGGGLSNRLGGYQPEPSYFAPAKYHFKYGVRDEYGGNDFGHQESRNGGDTKGVYYVQLPDGRRQIVNYYVNKGSGFVADIKYDGKAHFPPPAKYQGVRGYRARGLHEGLSGHGGLGGLDGSHGFLHGGESSINHISGGASEFDVHLPHGLDIHETSPYSSGGLGASLQSLH